MMSYKPGQKGAMQITDNSTETVISSQNTWTIVDNNVWTEAYTEGMSFGGNSLKPDDKGPYDITCTASVSIPDGTNSYDFAIFTDGTKLGGSSLEVAGSTEVENFSLTGGYCRGRKQDHFTGLEQQ
jgi:hypothetical protein